MKSTLFTLAALAASASALALPQFSTRSCTEYCSDGAGCVCVDLPANCTATYVVQPDDHCTSIAESFGNFTVSQLYIWNPDVTQSCQALRAYAPVCINTPDYVFTPPVQPDYGTHYTPSQTPVPTMSNYIESCQEFELIAPGTRVETLAEENGFAVDDFAPWNGNQTGAWADYWACVKA